MQRSVNTVLRLCYKGDGSGLHASDYPARIPDKSQICWILITPLRGLDATLDPCRSWSKVLSSSLLYHYYRGHGMALGSVAVFLGRFGGR